MSEKTKLIIVTVGTSILSNYQHPDKALAYQRKGLYYSSIAGYLKAIERLEKELAEAPEDDYIRQDIRDNQDDIAAIFASKYFNTALGDSPSIAAELSSLDKILGDKPENFVIHLLATDTALSMLAAKLIQAWVYAHRPRWMLHFEWPRYLPLLKATDSLFVVKDLRVKSMRDYEAGFMNLLEVLQGILQHPAYKDLDAELNITGGYKAIIPITTLFAQIKGLKLRYLYSEEEGEAELIELGNLPVDLDWGLAERYGLLLESRKHTAKLKEARTVSDAFKTELLKLEDELVKLRILSKNNKELTALGKIFEHFLQKRYEAGKTNLGFFMEYKCLEYYAQFYKTAKVSRSVHIKEPLKGEKGTEIDLLIELSSDNGVFEGYSTKPSGDYITVEVKALSAFDLKQAKAQIDHLKNQNWHKPKTIKLVWYSFLPDTYAKGLFLDTAKSGGLQFAQFLHAVGWGEIPLEIDLLNIDIDFGRPNDLKNKLMKERLCAEHFKTCYRFECGKKIDD